MALLPALGEQDEKCDDDLSAALARDQDLVEAKGKAHSPCVCTIPLPIGGLLVVLSSGCVCRRSS